MTRSYLSMRVKGCLASVAILMAGVLVPVVGGCGESDPSGASGSTTESKSSVAAPADLLNEGQLTVGTDFTNAPYSYIEGSTRKGVDVDLTAALAKQMGLEPNAIDTRFASLIPGLQANRLDAIIADLYMTAERAKVVSYVPTYKTGIAFLVKPGSYKPQKPPDLCGHTVAVLQGANIERILLTQVRGACQKSGSDLAVKSFPSDPEAYNQVIAGNADVHVADRAFAVSKAKGRGLVKSSTDILYPVAVGIGIRKGDAAIETALTKAMDALRSSGELQRILDRYGLEYPSPALIRASLKGS